MNMESPLNIITSKINPSSNQRESLDCKSLVKLLSSDQIDYDIIKPPNSAMKYLLSPYFNEESQNRDIISTYIENGSHNTQYSVIFPPGSMGLELEPVITSYNEHSFTERLVGCRVKDFYFREDHVGISRSFITKYVAIGDIITHIENESVLALPFTEVVEKLKSISHISRKIFFKNICSIITNGKV